MSVSRQRFQRTCLTVLLVVLLTACSTPGEATVVPRPTPGTAQRSLGLTDLGSSAPSPSPAATQAVTPSATSSRPPASNPAAASLPNVPTASAPVVTQTANLRAGPGTEYPIVGSVAAGGAVHIVATNRDRSWYELDNGQWIFGQLVTDPPPALQVEMKIPPTPIPPATPTTARPRPTPTAQPSPGPAYTGPIGCEGRSGMRYGAICRDGTTSEDTSNTACSLHGGVQAWTVCP